MSLKESDVEDKECIEDKDIEKNKVDEGER